MLRVTVAFLAVATLSGCAAKGQTVAAPHPSPTPSLGQVPIGASLARHTQEIYLESLSDSRPIRDGLWVSGNGHARPNGGSSLFGGGGRGATSAVLEVEVPTGSCADLLKTDLPEGRTIKIVGKGRFQSAKVSNDYVGKFVLDDIASCESVAEN